MIASFLSPQEQNEATCLMSGLHNTFARPITIFKTAQESVIYTQPQSGYNFTRRPSRNTTIIQVTPESGIFNCRVMWGDGGLLKRAFEVGPSTDDGDDALRLDLSKAVVRIKFGIENLPFFQDIQTAIVDGVQCEKFSSIKLHGPIATPLFGTIYLKQTS